MEWADLFDRAEADRTDVETIRAALAERREAGIDRDASGEGGDG